MNHPPGDLQRGSAPARLCLGGEDLDWIGGPALLAAIDLRVAVTFERVPAADDLAIEADGTLRAALNVSRSDWFEPTISRLELVRLCWQSREEAQSEPAGGRIDIHSTAPPGAGLASSATTCVAALRAFTAPSATDSPDQLMADAYHVERVMAGRPVGPMDFVPAAYGGTTMVTSDAEQIADLTSLSLPANAVFLVVDTRTPRDTGAVIAWKRARLAERDAGIRIYTKRMTELVEEQGRLLRSGASLDTLGQTLDTAQNYLARHLRVSTPLIDACIERLRTNGALGAKLTGTGFGGCLFALVPDEPAGHRLATCLADLPVSVHVVAPAPPTATAGPLATAASSA